MKPAVEKGILHSLIIHFCVRTNFPFTCYIRLEYLVCVLHCFHVLKRSFQFRFSEHFDRVCCKTAYLGPRWRTQDFYLQCNIQTGSGAYPDSYSSGTGTCPAA
jgi:hypothetical protein